MAGGGYFLKPPSAVDVPQYVSASTPQGLVREMLKNNLKLKGHVQYHSIQFAEGRWYAWFLQDISESLKKGNSQDGATDNI
jgi:hypothetical protein